MDTLEHEILSFLNRPAYKPVRAKSLAKHIGVAKHDRPAFLEALARLIDAGRVREGKNGRLKLHAAPGLVTGIIRRISSGAGFLIPHQTTVAEQQAGTTDAGQPAGRDARQSVDIYIAPHDLLDAHTGDEVLVRLLDRRRRGGQRCGRVEEVVERATHTFVGTYAERSGQGFVQIDGSAFQDPILVGDPGAKGVRPDDKVVIEMLRFPSHSAQGEAVLTRVLGPRGDPGVDTQSIIHEFALPNEFPAEVLEEAHAQADRFDENDLSERRDLTHETIVTIDPVDARDFDDAISLTKSDDGHWRLGVHIADVSHFVQPGSVLDGEALRRGTSVYLPGQVLPMLPEIISNGLASLQQDRVRYTKSVMIEFTGEGIPVHTEFLNSAIRVSRRFSYEEVMPIIRDPERFRGRVGGKVRALLIRMHELAMLLRKRRFQAGALELHLSEVKLDFDEQGRVAGAHAAEHDASHQIIEEFMLAANCAVATELTDRGIAFLRRTHGDPNIVKLQAFAEFVKVLGHPLKQFQSRHELQALLNRVVGTAMEHAVNYAFLRSMKQAEYSGEELGHYALAVSNYCHFTSPIRRYPDLAVHRLFDAVVTRGRRTGGADGVELAKLGTHCSHTERRAEKAERELTKVKLLTYMQERVGDELETVITGVERFGFFCQGIEIPVEGLVHISWLSGDDDFYFDDASFSLIARRGGRQFRLGDRVRVKVAHVDVDRRELDFHVVAQRRAERPASKKPIASAPPPKRGAANQTRKKTDRPQDKPDASTQRKRRGKR